MKEEVRGHRVAIDSFGLVVSLPNPSLSLLLSLSETRGRSWRRTRAADCVRLIESIIT